MTIFLALIALWFGFNAAFVLLRLRAVGYRFRSPAGRATNHYST